MLVKEISLSISLFPFSYFHYSWEEKIPLSKSALENTWLFHEIGRCYLEIGENVEEAREYGQRSFSEAKKAEDQVWELNAGVLIAQANGEQCSNTGCSDYTFSIVFVQSIGF